MLQAVHGSSWSYAPLLAGRHLLIEASEVTFRPSLVGCHVIVLRLIMPFRPLADSVLGHTYLVPYVFKHRPEPIHALRYTKSWCRFSEANLQHTVVDVSFGETSTSFVAPTVD